MPRNFETRRQETNAVKKALAQVGINALVAQGKGTAYGWIDVNIGNGSQWGEHQRIDQNSWCDLDCLRCKNLKAMQKQTIEIVQSVTGRHGDYDGRICLMTQDGWSDKKGSFSILHPEWVAPVEEVEDITPIQEPVAAAPTDTRIKPVEIEISRAEGMIDECVTVIIKDRHGDCDLWAASDRILKSWAMSVLGGYDKCDFIITYADGETYSGRFDLEHKHMNERNLLAGHIQGLADFYCGFFCPDHMSRESYLAFIASHQETGKSYSDFTSAYMVGNPIYSEPATAN